MAKVWDKPITAETDWGGDASTDNLPVSGRQVQAWIKSNIKSDAQISQLLVSWLNTHTINSPVFWKGLPIDADTLSWDGDKLTVIGSDGESQPIDEQFLINFLQENGYLTKGDYPFVYDAEKKVWLFTGDLVATGAITMFGSIEGFTPSTIMDAVQVDGRTIVKNAAGQLVAIGGGGSGGGLIVDDVNALIEAALVPVQEEIGLKWTEDSDSIYRWNLAFSWGDHSKEGYALKTYVDDELTKYILLDTAQDINAQHNFKKGLFIDGLPITKVNSNTIFLDANLVIGGAITMFGNNSSTFKAIWENIPFDSTMQWNGSTWSVVGGGGSSINESAVNLLIGEYLTNNNYASEQWVSNQGYAKQSSLNGVDNRLKSVETFFATSDTDNLVNKWSEIVTFLNATEGDTLDNILKTKANQSALDDAVASLTTEIGKKWTQNDVKIANWDSAYGWGNHANAGYAAKTYVDGELAKYVKLATAQTISARHNFSDGLQIGGITIRKSQDGVVYIDGNLVIKGALTMFGTDATIPSSIWASIPFDSTMKWDGSKWSVAGGGSGSVDDAKVNVLISEYLAKNSYATQSWVQNQGYLTTHQSLSHLLSKTDAANTYQPIINSSNKLAYSLISGTPDLNVYFRSSDFSKSNIKSTLGISDWALATTKPSYTAAEVGAARSYGDVGANYSFGNWLGYSYNIAEHGAEMAGGVISAGNDWYGFQLNGYYAGNALFFRGYDAQNFTAWKELIHSDNIGSYNAGSATKLQTARTIWGQSFDGSGDISGLLTNVDGIRGSTTNGGYIGDRNKGLGTTDGGSMIYNYSSSPITFHIAGYEYMRITNGGNVVIGGTTADARLHVRYDSGTTGIELHRQGEECSIGFSSTVNNTRFVAGIWANCFNIWNENKGTIMAIADNGVDINGNLLTTGAITAPKIYAASPTATSLIEIKVNGSTSVATFGYENGYGAIIQSYKGGNYFLLKDDNTAYISCNTTVGGAITMFSQLSMKNVLDYDGLSLAQLAKIRPARFTWKDGRDNRIHVGGIADYIQPILPEVVYETVNKELTVDYGSAAFYVGASLIKPVIDHEKRIAELEREVKYLREENRQLRA